MMHRGTWSGSTSTTRAAKFHSPDGADGPGLTCHRTWLSKCERLFKVTKPSAPLHAFAATRGRALQAGRASKNKRIPRFTGELRLMQVFLAVESALQPKLGLPPSSFRLAINAPEIPRNERHCPGPMPASHLRECKRSTDILRTSGLSSLVRPPPPCNC